MAKGWVNLTPLYDHQRFQRAKRLARNWEKRIGQKLLEKFEEVKREQFNERIKGGHRLTYAELRKLNDVYK